MSTQTRIDLMERQVAQRNWHARDIIGKVELLSRHYVSHAMLCKHLLDIVTLHEGSIDANILELLKRMTDVIVRNHIKDFGVDPSWNSL